MTTDKKPTVYAVMRVTIEVPVRCSGGDETMTDLFRVAKQEAQLILSNRLPDDFRVIGQVEFSHAILKAN